MKYPKFKGWDWTEVVDYFDRSKKFDYKKPLENSEEMWWPGNKMAKDFTDWLWKHHDNKVAIKVCRLYTKEIAKHNHTYCGPLWQGLYDIEHDRTFINYFINPLKLSVLFSSCALKATITVLRLINTAPTAGLNTIP